MSGRHTPIHFDFFRVFVGAPIPPENLKESWSCSLTLTSRNILSISATIAVRSCLNLSRTPTRLLVQSGPCKRLLLREVPPYSAAASNTIRTFPGLLGLSTGKCGKYHVLRPVTAASSGVSLRAYPFAT